MDHDTEPRSRRNGPDVRRHRRRIGAMVAAFTAASGVSVGVLASGGVDDAAVVEQVAERITTTTVIEVTPGGGLLFPIDPSPRCLVLDNFGGYSKAGRPNGHEGVDIGADEGQEIYAVEDGELTRIFDDLSSAPGYGWSLVSDGDVQYRYYHLSGFAPGLEVGDRVTRGQVIGYVGDTGNATPGGWHLHFEVRPGPQPRFGSASPVDPVPLFDIPVSCTVY
jgi:murein DD-endopeptidase MepM/ murein hydrolase activator NlpD